MAVAIASPDTHRVSSLLDGYEDVAMDIDAGGASSGCLSGSKKKIGRWCSLISTRARNHGSNMAGKKHKPGDHPTSAPGLWQELLRRRVFRVAAGYLVVAWLVLQVGSELSEALDLPESTMPVLVLILALGLPIAVVLAWMLQLTPQGISLDPGDDSPRGTGDGIRAADVAVLAILFVAFTAVAWLAYKKVIAPPSRVPPIASAIPGAIAVLPFKALDQHPETRYFGDGLAEEILTFLERLDKFRVMSRTSSFAHRDSGLDAVEIAQILRAELVLEGSVAREGDRLRVVVRLVDGVTSVALWNDRYERQLTDVFRIQDDIARAVSDALKVALTDASATQLGAQPTRSDEAVDLVLRARGRLRAATNTRELDAALALFQRAVALDTNYAQAHAGVCESFLERYRIRRGEDDFRAAETACREAGGYATNSVEIDLAQGRLYLSRGQPQRALEYFDRILRQRPLATEAIIGRADAYRRLGRFDDSQETYRDAIDTEPGYWKPHDRLGALYFSVADYERATEQFAAAIALNPRFAAAYNSMGASFYLMGEFGRAVEAYEESLRIDPTHEAHSNLGSMFYYLNDFELALDHFTKAADLAPDEHLHRGNMGDTLTAAGAAGFAEAHYRDALDRAQRRLAIDPTDAKTQSAMARYRASLNETASADELIASALAIDADDMDVQIDVALAYARTERSELALEHLDYAVRLGYPSALLSVEPGFTSLRNHPKFRALARTQIASTESEEK